LSYGRSGDFWSETLEDNLETIAFIRSRLVREPVGRRQAVGVAA